MLNMFYDKFIFTNNLKFKHNNFYLMNIPFIICPVDMFAEIAGKEDMELNKKIYYSVKESVKKDVSKDFSESFALIGDKFHDLLSTYFSASGWGNIKTVDFSLSEKRAIVSVEDSAVALALKGKVKKQADHFLRGVLAGIFSVAYNTDFDCVELKCHALNDKPCEFVLKEKGKFDKSKEEFKLQL